MRALGMLGWFAGRNSVLGLLRKPARLLGFAVCVCLIGLVVTVGIGTLYKSLPASVGRALIPQRPAIEVGSGSMLAIIMGISLSASFLGQSFFFTQSEIDYIFASPIPRRTVLLRKSRGVVLGALASGALLAVMFRMAVGQPVAQALGRDFDNLPGIAGCAIFTLATSMVSIALEMRFGKRYELALVSFIIVLGLASYVLWCSVSDGSALHCLSVPWLACIITPGKLAAQCLAVGAFGGEAPLGRLCLFLIPGLVGLFAQEVNYYELAASITATREAYRAEIRAGKAVVRSESTLARLESRAETYSFPRFGAGPTALLWANLAGMAKNRTFSFWLPSLLGFGLGLFTAIYVPEALDRFTPMFGGLGLLMHISLIGGLAKTSLIRQPIVRPLPFTGVDVALADVIPTLLPLGLFTWSFGVVGMIAMPKFIGVSLAVCLEIPMLGLAAGLITYGVTFLFPEVQDLAQRAFAYLSGLLLQIAFGWILWIVWKWTNSLSIGVGTAALGLLSTCLTLLVGRFAGWAYDRSEP